MMAQGDDYLKDWLMDTGIPYNHPERTNAAIGVCVSPYIPIPSGCKRIAVKYWETAFENSLRQYACKDDYTYSDGWSPASPATLILPANAVYVRCQMKMADIDDCYIKDETHNVYLWKGKNVT